MDDEVLDLPAIAMLRHLQAGRNKNLNRGFRKLVVWREAVELYVFVKQELGKIIRMRIPAGWMNSLTGMAR